MRRRPVWIGALALAALLVGAVLPVRVAREAPEAVSDDTVVARIGETTYTLADIRQRLARLEASYRYAAERRLPEYVREVVRREVLAREARRLGLDRAPALQAEIEEAVQAILLRALVKQVMIEAMPGPEEVQAYYQAHEAEFRLPEQVEVNQVRVEGVQIHEDLLKVTILPSDSPPAAAEPPGAPVPAGAVPPK